MAQITEREDAITMTLHTDPQPFHCFGART